MITRRPLRIAKRDALGVYDISTLPPRPAPDAFTRDRARLFTQMRADWRAQDALFAHTLSSFVYNVSA